MGSHEKTGLRADNFRGRAEMQADASDLADAKPVRDMPLAA